MYTSGTMLLMVCESPLHAGTGSDLDFIDKPIQRERHTKFPKIEGSSLKGALRERIGTQVQGRNDHCDMKKSFGPFNPKTGEEGQGALGFSDARLLLFPVKSMKGIFAWVTCPRVLKRFERDRQRLQSDFKIEGLPELEYGKAIIFGGELVYQGDKVPGIVLEEFDFPTESGQDIKIGDIGINKWLAEIIYPEQDYWKQLLQENLVILHDDDFADFVEFTTEVITRNQIDPDTGTVKKGHLFTEEYLPADSVLYSMIFAHQEFKADKPKSAEYILDFFTKTLTDKCGSTFQTGGNASIGKGLIRAVISPFIPQNKSQNHAKR